jgi:parvulin-like peptidyl-prolyl isomerase
MKVPRSALVIAFVTCLGLPAFAETTKRVVVMDRIVAVVGDEIVTLVELRRRAAPLLIRIKSSVGEAERPRAEAEMYRELLRSIVEEHLILRVARTKQISVSGDEINSAAEGVAKSNKITTDELYEQAAAQGMDRVAYRDELARQLLRFKVLRQITPSAVLEANKGKPEAELAKAVEDSFSRWIEQQKQEVHVEVRL